MPGSRCSPTSRGSRGSCSACSRAKRALQSKQRGGIEGASNSRRVEIGEPIGLAVNAMTPQQADALMALIRVYLDRMRPELAQAELEKIMGEDIGAIRFAWAGSAEVGGPHYYRIHGPTFLIEYDNTQSDSNHIHSVWRDLTNDFGVDVLAEHYATAHAL